MVLPEDTINKSCLSSNTFLNILETIVVKNELYILKQMTCQGYNTLHFTYWRFSEYFHIEGCGVKGLNALSFPIDSIIIVLYSSP